MRRFLSSECVPAVNRSARVGKDREEELIADSRGALLPSHWVERKLQALLRDAPVSFRYPSPRDGGA
jgi:hypothetical protein